MCIELHTPGSSVGRPAVVSGDGFSVLGAVQIRGGLLLLLLSSSATTGDFGVVFWPLCRWLAMGCSSKSASMSGFGPPLSKGGGGSPSSLFSLSFDTDLHHQKDPP